MRLAISSPRDRTDISLVCATHLGDSRSNDGDVSRETSRPLAFAIDDVDFAARPRLTPRQPASSAWIHRFGIVIDQQEYDLSAANIGENEGRAGLLHTPSSMLINVFGGIDNSRTTY